MSFRIRSTPQTDADIEAAFDWYESELAGLGMEFLDELRTAYARIEENPLKYEIQKWDIRRALTRRFPYAVYFMIEGSDVVVLAVMNTAQDPGRWRARRSPRISEP